MIGEDDTEFRGLMSDLLLALYLRETKLDIGKWGLGWDEVSILVGALNLGSAADFSPRVRI